VTIVVLLIRTGCDFDNRNIFVVIYNTDIR